MTAGLSGELASWAASTRWEDLPAAVREATQYRLVDSLGLMLAGSATPAGRAVRELVLAQGGDPQATVLGESHRLPTASVALVHGSWAHVHDFDDTEPDTVIHPTSPIAAACLAVGESRRSSPEEILTAVAVGVEVMCRLGVPAGRGFHHRGFHATAVVGPLAVALASGLLMHADTEVIVSGMGLAGSMSGGLLAFLSDGSWSKRLHPGWAAHGGLTAIGLASHGFRGPAQILEDRYGLYRAFLHEDDIDPSLAVAGLGSTWRSTPLHLKRYPCAHVIQPFLDTVLAADLDLDDVEEIVLRLPQWQVPIVCEPWETKVDPATEYQARTSLPFALASAVADRRVGIETFEAVSPVRAEVHSVLQRLRYEADDELSGFDVRLHVVAKSGSVEVLLPPSHERPLPDALGHKLRTALGTSLTSSQRDVLLSAVDDVLEGRVLDPMALVKSLGPMNEEVHSAS